MSRVNPYFLLLIGVISVSTSAIFVKLANAPSGVIAFYRLFFAVVIMLPFIITNYTKELRLISRRDLIMSAFAGVFLALHFILWFESLNYTSVASSTVLVTLQPLFAFIGAYLFFNEKFTIKAALCGSAAIGGSIIISWGDFQISGAALYGDILALIACALVTAYMLVGQSVRRRLSLMTYTFLVYSISALSLFLYVILMNEHLYPYESSDWLYFLLLAIVPTLLGHSLFNGALKWLSTTTISMAILFEPVGAAFLAYITLAETIKLSQVIGGLIIILSISLYLVDVSKRVNYKESNQ